MFDVVARRFFQTAPEKVALEKDFNTIDLEGHAPDAFEQAMASVESDIGPALTRIIEARSLDNEDDKTFLLNLIGLLHLRNPRFREIKRSFHERVAKMILDIALSSKQMWDSQIKRAQDAGFIPKGTDTSYETAKASYKEENYKIEVPTEEHIRSEMQTFDHALPLLFERKWVLVRAPQGSPGFVTCDHPVSLTWSEPTRARPGLKLKGTEILFPISPDLAVVGAFERSRHAVFRACWRCRLRPRLTRDRARSKPPKRGREDRSVGLWRSVLNQLVAREPRIRVRPEQVNAFDEKRLAADRPHDHGGTAFPRIEAHRALGPAGERKVAHDDRITERQFSV